jgi:hypothetical protein
MCVKLGALRGTPDSRVPGTVRFDLKPRTFGNGLVGSLLVSTPYRLFRFTLQGLNQSVVGLSLLSETTYPTGHDIPNDGTL